MSAANEKITIEVEETSPVARALRVRIPAPLVEEERGRVARRLARDLQVPGFRKGKVPTSYVLKSYRGDVDRETIQGVVPRAYDEAIETEKIDAVSRPDFEDVRFDEDGSLSFKASVEIRPLIELGATEGFRVEVPRKTIEDEDVAEALEQLRQRAASYRVVERAAAPGDLAVIDYVPLDGKGAPIEKERMINQPVALIEEEIFPEFFEGLQGLSMGDAREIEVAYPEDRGPEERRGRRVTFRVRLKEIKEKVVPEVDDAFAAQVGEFESLAELNENLRRRLEEEEASRFERETRRRLVSALIEANPVQVPASMVANLLEAMVRDAMGPRYEDESEEGETMREEWRRLMRPGAEREVRRYLLFEALRRAEGIEVEDAEVETRIFEIAAREHQAPEKLKAQLESRDRLESIRDSILEDKVYALLAERSEIVTVPAEEDDGSADAQASGRAP